MSAESERSIAKAVDAAELFAAPSSMTNDIEKPRLLVEVSNPDRTVASLRDILATAGELYDRGGPIRLAYDQLDSRSTCQDVGPELLVLLAHLHCRPYVLQTKSSADDHEVNAPLPRSIAKMYLDWLGEQRLPPLRGISTAPLLSDDGQIRSVNGYDRMSGLWCENVPDVGSRVPDRPTRTDAENALQVIRETFKTFAFADARTVPGRDGNAPVVDVAHRPGRDESALLVALLTAVCRASLPLAPGILMRAAQISGGGTGKGLLVRCMSIIAFGHEPSAFTGGESKNELEKRIAAELMKGSSVMFLDNLNATQLKSDLLASAITERHARVRVLGKSEMVRLNTAALVVVTGNGLIVSEDLARRFIYIDLDARTEDPETRSFASDVRAHVVEHRAELLAACLTIWRWGRTDAHIPLGLSLGSFEEWCRWVRDPLLALGCRDPVERVSEAKARDPHRRHVSELYAKWFEEHGDQPTTAHKLNPSVKKIIDPQDRGRQFVTAALDKLVGTRLDGYVLTRQEGVGDWGTATYALKPANDGEDHRGHRDHSTADATYAPYAPYDLTQVGRASDEAAKALMTPVPPMPLAVAAGQPFGRPPPP